MGMALLLLGFARRIRSLFCVVGCLPELVPAFELFVPLFLANRLLGILDVLIDFRVLATRLLKLLEVRNRLVQAIDWRYA
jgi:hypothetical protein